MSEITPFRHFFNQIDLYGLTFPLRYRRHKEYNTLCGITLSLITIIGMSAVILFFIIQNFKRTEMSIISNTQHLYGKSLFNFSNNPFLIGYVNNDGRAVKIDPTYLTITLDKNDHYADKDENGIIDLRRVSTPIKLEYCKMDVHLNGSHVKEMIKEFEYENYLCPIPGQNLSIGGRWGDHVNGYDMLEFHVIRCENTSKEQNCRTPEEMEIFFKNSYFSVIYLAQSLDHYDAINPIKKKFRSEIFLIVTQLVKRYYYYFIPGEYISDNGLFFNNIKTFDFFQYDRVVIDFVDKEDQDYYSGATIAEVCFSSIDKFITYERKYSKIQDSLGNIGGWIRIILVVCQFISDYFSEKIFLVDIINSIASTSYPRRIPPLKLNKSNSGKINNFIKEENNSNYKFQQSPISLKPSMKENKNENENADVSSLPITNIKKQYFEFQKNVQLSILEYCLPLWTMEKNDKYSFFMHYKDFIYKDISLEVLVPLVERLLKMNIIKERKNKAEYISKLSSSVFNIVNGNDKINNNQ